MSKESDFLLGMTFTLLTQCRACFIINKDRAGISMIEDEYQSIKKSLETHFNYVVNKDIEDEIEGY